MILSILFSLSYSFEGQTKSGKGSNLSILFSLRYSNCATSIRFRLQTFNPLFIDWLRSPTTRRDYVEGFRLQTFNPLFIEIFKFALSGEASKFTFQSSFHWATLTWMGWLCDKCFFQSSFHWVLSKLCRILYTKNSLSILFSLSKRTYTVCNPYRFVYFQSSFHWVFHISLGVGRRTLYFQSSFHWGKKGGKIVDIITMASFNPLFIEFSVNISRLRCKR